ncbi:smoothelin cytoskeleton protein domain-containing protein [Phthorimaea operculella]|nr:smoothelin cytoskeleton protein domain-containing protein [Phthorimaea operculella]
MSEGDVSMIRDEDVLRRMWQQTEDFGKKKEIRAHMYRLREERLRSLYSPEPNQGKGMASAMHVQSLADQSFQGLKSKEVRDAGSPPKEFCRQDLKELSNAGWNVESENKITDDGHTKIRAMHADIQGRYDVEGGQGKFEALDSRRQAHTEYQDANTSVKKDEATAKTAHAEQVVRKTDDGTQFSSSTKTSSTSSTKFEKISTQVPYDESDQEFTRKTNTSDYEKTLRNSNFENGELISRKVDYPDDVTKVIVETRCLPDGTRVTSTRKEFRTPVQSTRSEQHSSKSESRMYSNTSHRADSSSKIVREYDIVDSQRKADDNDFRRNRIDYQNVDEKLQTQQNIQKTSDTKRFESRDSSSKITRESVDTQQEFVDKKRLDTRDSSSKITRESIERTQDVSDVKRSENVDLTSKIVRETVDRRQDVSDVQKREDCDYKKNIQEHHVVRDDVTSDITNQRYETKIDSKENKFVTDDTRNLHIDYSTTQRTDKYDSNVDKTDRREIHTTKDNQNVQRDIKDTISFKNNEERLHNSAKDHKTDEMFDKKAMTSDQYQTTYSNDYTQKKISNDWSPTHQAWASTLRNDTPPTTRATSPGSRTYQSSTSSLRSSVSPDKTYRKPSSRGGSPSKTDRAYSSDRYSSTTSTHSVTESKNYKHVSPDRKPPVSPSRYGSSPDRKPDGYRQRPSQSPDKRPDFRPSSSPERKPYSSDKPSNRGYSHSTSPVRSSMSPDKKTSDRPKDVHIARPSASPERKPYKPTTSPDYTRTKSPVKDSTRPSSSPDRKPGYEPSPTKTTPGDRYPKESSPTRPSSSPDRKPSYMRPTAASKTPETDRKSPTKDVPSYSPERKTYGKSTIKEDHYKFIDEETKMYTRTDRDDSTYTKRVSSSPDRYSGPRDRSPSPSRSPDDVPDYARADSPSLRSSLRKGRSPSPPKGPVTFTDDQTQKIKTTTADVSTKYDDHITKTTKSYDLPTKEMPREPSPSKYGTYDNKRRSEETEEVTSFTTRKDTTDVKYDSLARREKTTKKTDLPVSPTKSPKEKTTDSPREPSPTKYGTYDKKRRSEETEEVTSFTTRKDTTDLKYDSLTRREKATKKTEPLSPTKSPKDIPTDSPREPAPTKYDTYDKKRRTEEITTTKDSTDFKHDSLTRKQTNRVPDSPTKKIPRGSVSPVKSPTKDSKYKHTTDFISTEKTTEEINKKTSVTDRSRKLVTPSTSPTRKPKTEDTAPSTGQSSPTTSVSGFVYFSSPKTETIVTDLDDEEYFSQTNKTTTTHERPKTLNVERSPSPSKIPCRSPSLEKKTPTKDSLPRKSSLKKPSTDNINLSPEEKPPSSFRVSPAEEVPQHKIVKKDRPDKPLDTPIKPKAPFERRETYEERCLKILGVVDNGTETETKKTKSSSVSPCYSPERESTAFMSYVDKKNTNKVNVTDFIAKEVEDTIKKSTAYECSTEKKDRNLRTPSRESSPAKLQDIISQKTVTKHDEIDDIRKEYASKITRESPNRDIGYQKPRSNVSPVKKSPQPTYQSPDRKYQESGNVDSTRTTSPLRSFPRDTPSKTSHEKPTEKPTKGKSPIRPSASPDRKPGFKLPTESTSHRYESLETSEDHETTIRRSLDREVGYRKTTDESPQRPSTSPDRERDYTKPSKYNLEKKPQDKAPKRSSVSPDHIPGYMMPTEATILKFEDSTMEQEICHHHTEDITKEAQHKIPIRSSISPDHIPGYMMPTEATILKFEDSTTEQEIRHHHFEEITKKPHDKTPKRSSVSPDHVPGYMMPTEATILKFEDSTTEQEIRHHHAEEITKKPHDKAPQRSSISPDHVPGYMMPTEATILKFEDSTTETDICHHHDHTEEITSTETVHKHSKVPEKLSSRPDSPTRKPAESKLPRAQSPSKKHTTTEDTTLLIKSEREREVLDRVQQSLRKLSPNRENRSPSRERSPGKTTISLHDIDVVTSDTQKTCTQTIKEEDKKTTVKGTTLKTDITRTVKTKDDKPKDQKPGSKAPSRTVSPTKKPSTSPDSMDKSRSISPKKPLSPTDRSQSPHVSKPSGIKPREPTPSSFVRKPSGNVSPTKTEKITIDVKKTTITKQNSASKIATKTTTTRIPSSTNKTEPEPKRAPTPKGNKENVSPKKEDIKVTRTASDTSLKNKKPTPQRMKSKPEIQVNDLSPTRVPKTSFLKKPTGRETPTKLAPKPKSATALNSTKDDDEVIIDMVEQAKSSRENSPDRICPTPVSFLEDVGTPRYPDEVREPDDDFRNRTHHTIHETESIVDDIVEIDEDDELFVKKTEFDHISESDECLLSVTDKVSKFTNKIETVNKPKDSTAQFKDVERKVHSDFVDENLKSDECLLSVSEKVNKFAKGPQDARDKSPSRRIVDEYDTQTVYQDDYTKLSVNDKAHLFIETAENSKAPKTKPSQKVERPDLSNVDESLKSDECLLSVSDKVHKFVKTAEQFLQESIETEEKDRKVREKYEMFMQQLGQDDVEDIEETKTTHQTTTKEKSSETKDRRVSEEKIPSFAKETTASHTKIREYPSPNLKPADKTPTVKITTLRSSEAVKKAKALFENIATTQQTTDTKTTKLLDIGVTKKSPKTDSTTVLHPSVEDLPHEPESDVDGRPSSGTPIKRLSQPRFDKSRSPSRHTTQSPEVPRTKSPVRHHMETTTTTKSVLSRYPAAQNETPKKTRSEVEKVPKRTPEPKQTRPETEKPQDKTPSYQRPTATGQIKEEKTVEETEVSTRRGSGKFGVELRRTSVERSTVSSERRRSSTDHHQPCIEDIFDLDLLEQMLEKVVGYEQRRRIRAQIRVARKKETESDTTYTRHTKTTKTRSPERRPQTKSPERKTPQKISQEYSSTITHKSSTHIEHSQPKEQSKPLMNGHAKEPSEKRQRPQSPEKPRPTKTRSPVRQPSPEKKTRTVSPSKVSPKPKPSRFNEYASAYMKRVGLNETDKVKLFDKTKRTEAEDLKTKQGKTVTKADTEDVTTKQFEEHSTTETKSMTMSKSFSERTSSKETIEVVHVNGKRSPSPEKKRRIQSPTERLYQRSPSPDFKRKTDLNKKETVIKTVYESEPKVTKKETIIRTVVEERPKIDTTKKETIIKTVYEIEKKVAPKQIPEEKPSWAINRNLKKVTSETRTFSNKKVEEKKVRPASPSKAIVRPIDAVVSSYGPGPLDADGKPLFGIKALRNGSSNYQVKGTVIRQEYHSRNGSEPEGTVSVTAYSTEPEDLERLLQSQGEKPSRIHGLAAITTTKKFGGETGTSFKEAHSVERREDKKTVRQSSVKSLTEKYIKSASDTSKSERTTYPKAGLILRTTNLKDSVSSDSSGHAGLGRTDSAHSLGSVEDNTVVTTRTTQQLGDGVRTTTTTRKEVRGHEVKGQERSFLDSSTKVTGVQDILSRMRNADIVRGHEVKGQERSFLDSSTKVTGVQDILSRMRNADIVRGHEVKGQERSFLDSSTKVTGVQDILSRMRNADIVRGHEAKGQERSFLDSSTKVTGVQDILSRMRNADIETTLEIVVSSAAQVRVRLGSVEDNTVVTTRTTQQLGDGVRTTTTTRKEVRWHEVKGQERSFLDSSTKVTGVQDILSRMRNADIVRGHEVKGQERSFLDSSTKVTGVQDILSRMRNADIVIEDGDTTEDSEARALLNKFLGATVLMAGMQNYIQEKPSGNISVRKCLEKGLRFFQPPSYQETTRSTTAGGKTTTTSKRVEEIDLERCWDEPLLRKLLEESTDYEQRRRIRARIRNLMAEQEACASAVTEALAAGADQTAPDNDARGESLLLPLLQGLLGSGGEKLLAGLGAAGADVVADVRRSLARLRAALAPPANHPQANALLQLADRLEDALAAADRIDGCRRRPKRRSRANRHTVGVTQEELEQARRLVDRDQLTGDMPRESVSSGSTAVSTAPSGEPTPERRPSIDPNEPKYEDAVSHHNPVAAKQKQAPVAQQANIEPTPVNHDAVTNDVVERRAPGVKRNEFFRHSIADQPMTQSQPLAQPPSQGFPRMDRRPSEKSGIAAIANKFNAQIQKENANPPPRRFPKNAPIVQQKQAKKEDNRQIPLYVPLPPTYNFAAPPVEESKPLPRFNNAKRNRMKRANTINIGGSLANYLDSDTDDDKKAPLVPPFRPQTENDRKFVAFMQKNEQQNGINGHANWSNRFGNIKNTFESRERDDMRSFDNSRSSSSSSARQVWRNAEQPIANHMPPAPRASRRVLADVNPNNEVIKPPWANEKPARTALRTQTQMIHPPMPTPPSPQKAAPPVFPSVPPQSPTKPVVVKPFAAKPIPVNQFSHNPMSAFKPPKKIMSPVAAPNSLVWSPPSVVANNAVSPSTERPPGIPTSPRPVAASPTPPWAAATDKPRRTANLASRFEGDKISTRGAPLPSPPRYSDIPNYSAQQNYPVRPIPSQNDLSAPELVKKLETVRPNYDPPPYKSTPQSPRPYESVNQNYNPQPIYQPPQQTYQPPQQAYQPPQLAYQPPQQTYQPPQQNYRSPQPPYEPPPPKYEPPKIDAQKLQIEFYEKQIREKARREAEKPPPPAYTITEYTPTTVSTFVPLQHTPDIEKARAHKVDYLPDVVNETSNYEPAVAPPRSPLQKPKEVPHAQQNGHAEETTEHGCVETRVMRGPVRGVATTTAGVRTRYDDNRRPAAADNLRDVLDRVAPAPQPTRQHRPQPRRAQVPAPAVQTPPPAHAPAISPAAPFPRSPLAASRDSLLSGESGASSGSIPLSKSGSWHQLAMAPAPAPKAPSPRRIVSRTKSMHMLAAPKLFEGGIAREELPEKKKTVEAYFSGQATTTTTSKSQERASSIRAKTSRSQSSHSSGGFALGRSRTMPAVTELQFLDETNADDAFEDLVSGLAATTGFVCVAVEETEVTVSSSVRRNSSEKTVSSSTTTKTSKVIESMTKPAPKPVSPFAKFRQLEKQNSVNSSNSAATPATPQSPGSPSPAKTPYFKFTDPALQASALTIKERLLQCKHSASHCWAMVPIINELFSGISLGLFSKLHKNVKLENFSTSWADGLAFCALIHHFLPDAFDYSKLTPQQRRHNFTLAFKVADEKAGIYPLLDVDDMVAMRKPDWKCVFTYVQAIHRRFKDEA